MQRAQPALERQQEAWWVLGKGVSRHYWWRLQEEDWAQGLSISVPPKAQLKTQRASLPARIKAHRRTERAQPLSHWLSSSAAPAHCHPDPQSQVRPSQSCVPLLLWAWLSCLFLHMSTANMPLQQKSQTAILVPSEWPWVVLWGEARCLNCKV